MKIQSKSIIPAILVYLFVAAPVSAQVLYVFYPSTTRPAVVQQRYYLIVARDQSTRKDTKGNKATFVNAGDLLTQIRII